MYYFFHGTTLESFCNIMRTGMIVAPYYMSKAEKKYIRMNPTSKYIFTNIYVDDLPLKSDETAGVGRITLIIDPTILKHKTCYFNYGWLADTDSSIIFNDNISTITTWLCNNYKYPYILTHEALFKKSISLKYVTCVICAKSDRKIIKKYMRKYGYAFKLFDEFPVLDRSK